MGTYADWWNAQQPALIGGNDGPVRLTISRGEYKLSESTGQLEYQESWAFEQGMDVEATDGGPPSALDALEIELDEFGPGSSGGGGSASETDEVMRDAAGDLLKQSNNFSKLGRSSEFSLLVLDTNVLMSCLPLLKHLFSLLFNQNTQFLLGQHPTIAPFALIVPKMVLRELDGLKSGHRSSSSVHAESNLRKLHQAQNANRWMLQALRMQKQWERQGVRMPEMLWALHVQTQEHVQSAAAHLSNDERIVALARHLQHETNLSVVLCSNDIHASLTAEAEGMATLELRSILASIRSEDDRETAALAKDLLEQWTAQHRRETSFGAAGSDLHAGSPTDLLVSSDAEEASSRAYAPDGVRAPADIVDEMDMDEVNEPPPPSLSPAHNSFVVPAEKEQEKKQQQHLSPSSSSKRIEDLPNSSASRWAPASRRGRR